MGQWELYDMIKCFHSEIYAAAYIRGDRKRILNKIIEDPKLMALSSNLKPGFI